MISPDRAGLQGKDKKPDTREVVTSVLLVVGAIVALTLASTTGTPWLRFLDLRVADGDPQRVVLAAVAWCWLLLVPITLAAWTSRRFGRIGGAAWLLVVAGVTPLVVFLPTELLGGSGTYPVAESSFDAVQEAAEEALGFGAPAGAVAWIAYVGIAGTLFLSVWVSDLHLRGARKQERPGIVETGGEWRAPLVSWLKAALAWTALWGAMAGLMLVFVESYPGRGTWLPTNAEELSAGTDGVTGGFQVALDADVAEVVPCATAAEALSVDGGSPDLPGCRSALLVSATGVVDETGDETGELVGVVLQTTTPGDIDPLKAALDGATLTEGGGLPSPPDARTLVTGSSVAFAVFVTAEDPGDAPAGDGSAAVPLTRSLAYLTIGTAQGLYVAPSPV